MESSTLIERSKSMSYKIIFTLLLATLTSACTSTPKNMYSWGNYQEQVYKMYSAPEKAAPQSQIIIIEKDIAKSKLDNKPVAPGVYAHLAYQYLLTGNKEKAIEYFELEKKQFPEATVYIDFLLKKIV
jgi:hypothetical protein